MACMSATQSEFCSVGTKERLAPTIVTLGSICKAVPEYPEEIIAVDLIQLVVCNTNNVLFTMAATFNPKHFILIVPTFFVIAWSSGLQCVC